MPTDANPRGIPRSPFIEDVEAHVGPSNDVEPVLKSLQELLAKYRFMETNAAQRKANMTEKIPELRETIVMVEQLQKQEGDDALPVTFELSDTLYAKADIKPQSAKEVYLWLGANVMLAYEPNEAKELLDSKLKSAEKTLENSTEDLDWLREQITVTEVNIARCYNYSVLLRRKGLTPEGSSEGKAVKG